MTYATERSVSHMVELIPRRRSRRGIIVRKGKKMDFERLYARLAPRLRKIAAYLNGRGSSVEGDDLYQEMCVYLWNKYGSGVPEGINDAYIAKGCEFHARNYMRTHREKGALVSLETPVDHDGNTLADMLSEDSEPLDRIVDRKITIEYILNNGFSRREKEVFSLLLEGLTAREAGARLNISHVAVLKCRDSLISKWRAENN